MLVYFNLGLVISTILASTNGHLIQNNNGHEDMHPRSPGTQNWGKLADVEDAEHWMNLAQGKLESKLRQTTLETKAKNIIMFLGDGMSVSTVTASRIFKGQLKEGAFGEEADLHMDTFPYIGASKTYCSDWQVADSACSATAYLCGTKANSGTMGVKPTVLIGNCTTQMQAENQVSSILAWAQDKGMSTGIVTTTTVTHASPGAAYAHIAHRNWENDAKIMESGQDPNTCDDIAEQLILQKPGRDINVILGGGREHLTPTTTKDIEADIRNTTDTGKREDGKDLTLTWIAQKATENAKAEYVTSRETLLSLDVSNIDYLLGLFAPNSIAFADKQAENDDPTLAEMTEVALKILSRNPAGFFLFVEGGRIDHAHHNNNGNGPLLKRFNLMTQLNLRMTKRRMMTL